MLEMPTSPKHRRFASTAARVMCVAALGAIIAGSADAQPGQRFAPFTEQDLRNSPVASDSFRRNIELDATRRRVVVERMRNVAAHFGRLPLEIPEYHDEQRLSDGAGGYGPMAYIFGSPYLDGFTHVNHFNAHGPYGALVAVMWIDLEPGLLPSTYRQLNLAPEMNCVYLAHTGRALLSGWRAFVVPGTEAAGCQRPNAGTPVLEVHARQGSNQTAQADYPGVARFDEATTGHPLLGVRCLNAWCHIGAAGMTPEGPSHRTNAVLFGRREGRVHGWHDDQLLAVRDPATGDLRPQVRATVTPVRNLDTLSLENYTDRWIPVATIWLRDDPAGTKYATRWGMRRGRNILELSFSSGGWHARVAPASAPNSFTRLIVEQHKHLDMVVPGTARFRWRLSDDSVWVSCDQGCCRVDAT